nr:MAG TPA: lipoprotein [Caudoviricetes sp.]
MKKIVLLLIALLAVGCSKSEEKQEPQKKEPNKEQQENTNEQNKKEALIYFALAKTSLNNRLNKNKEFDFWTNTLKALEVSKGNDDVYKEVENFLKNNRFVTPRWSDSQQSEINKLIDNLKPQTPIINKYEEIRGFINAFNQWR